MKRLGYIVNEMHYCRTKQRAVKVARNLASAISMARSSLGTISRGEKVGVWVRPATEQEARSQSCSNK